MMCKVFARGGGGGSGVMDYMLGKERDRDGAKVLAGDPEQVKEIIDGLDFSRNYTALVLSFEEAPDVLNEKQKGDVMQRFEECMMPGLDKNQYACTWIEHTDKGRLELNLVVANVELQSGKRLQPYYDRADRPRVDALQNMINHEYGLTDPHDPSKKRVLTTAKDLPRDKKALSEAITHNLEMLIAGGEIADRKGIISAVENMGLEVVRETNKSISIKPPQGTQNIRLKGVIYERDFRASETLRSERIEQEREQYQASAGQRYEKNRGRYKRTFEAAAKRNKQSYRRALREPANTHQTRENQRIKLQLAGGRGIGASGASRRRGVGISDELVANAAATQRQSTDSSRRGDAKSVERQDAQHHNQSMHNARRNEQILRQNRPEIRKSGMGDGEKNHENIGSIVEGTQNDRNRAIIDGRIAKAIDRATASNRSIKRASANATASNRTLITAARERLSRIREAIKPVVAAVIKKAEAIAQKRRERGRGFSR